MDYAGNSWVQEIWAIIYRSLKYRDQSSTTLTHGFIDAYHYGLLHDQREEEHRRRGSFYEWLGHLCWSVPHWKEKPR